MYFYIHVHLDKAQIATLARLKASSDVIKRDRIRCLNVESNTIYYHAEKKQELGHVLGNQNRSHTSTFIHQQHDARKKIRRFLEEKLDTFFSIDNHARPPKERTRPPLRCFAYRKESECVCNLIFIHNAFPQCGMAFTNPCSVV